MASFGGNSRGAGAGGGVSSDGGGLEEAKLRVEDGLAAQKECEAALDGARTTLIDLLANDFGEGTPEDQEVAEGKAREIEGDPQGTLANQASKRKERGLADAKIAFEASIAEVVEAKKQLELLQAGQDATLADVVAMIQNFEGRMKKRFEQLKDEEKKREEFEAAPWDLARVTEASGAEPVDVLKMPSGDFDTLMGQLNIPAMQLQRVRQEWCEAVAAPAVARRAAAEAVARQKAKHSSQYTPGQWVRHVH